MGNRQLIRAAFVAVLCALVASSIFADGPPLLATNLAMARAVKKVNPEYPAAARQLGISGSQEVEITVSETGDVLEAKVTKGNAMFTNSSLTAIKQWKFTPYVKEGGPSKFMAVIQFSYSK